MGVTVLTESRWWSSESNRALEDLAADWARTAVTRVERRGTRIEYPTRGRFGGLDLKTIRRMVFGFGPQNPDKGSEEERMTRGSIEKFESRRSYLIKGVVAVG
jgi:hypothetical protein